MKTLSEINSTLKEFEKAYGISAIEAQQGSHAWHTVKLGVVSASNAAKVVAKRDSETRYTYLCELVAQVCTGEVKEFSSPETQWGKDHEGAARSTFEFNSGKTITELPFVFRDETFREGCSPDGIVDEKKGIEIKCPFNSVHYVKFFDEDRIKPEYLWQAQFTMRVLNAGEWEFGQFDPRMKKSPFKSVIVPRDEEMQKKLNDLVPEFLADMDAVLAKIGVKFGDQWKGKVF